MILNNDKCGIVILNYNSYNLTIDLANIISGYPTITDICVVDNCSRDDFKGMFSHPKIHYIKSNKNLGYSAGNNIGLKYLIEERNCGYVFIANPDVMFENITIDQMHKCMEKYPKIALLSTLRYGPDNALLHQYFDFPSLKASIKNCFFLNRRRFEKNRHIIQYKKLKETVEPLFVDAVPGAFFCLRSSFLVQNNYLYEGIFLYGEEIILGKQANELGYKSAVINSVQYIHNHKQVRFSNRKMFWYDRQSLIIYYRLFEKFNIYQWIILKIAIVLGSFEYNCAYWIYNVIRKIK